MKIGIMGAGAIGCYVGGRLATRGEEVTFVARARLKTELETAGLTLLDMENGPMPRRQLPPSSLRISGSPEALKDCDVVLVCVKSAQTPDVATALAEVLPANVVVVSMQNGVGNADALRQSLKSQVVLGGIVGFNVVGEGNGVFRQTTTGPLVIEASADPRVGRLLTALRDLGFQAESSADIRAQQWSKLVINLNNAISALTDVPTPRLIFEKDYRRILAAVMGEAIAVLRHARVRTAKLGALPVQLFPPMLRLPTPLLRVVARAQLKVDPEARSSMWQDLAAGRLTEVEYLNGEIVRLAVSSGTRAPINQRVVELIHDAEREGKGTPRMSANALWQAIGN